MLIISISFAFVLLLSIFVLSKAKCLVCFTELPAYSTDPHIFPETAWSCLTHSSHSHLPPSHLYPSPLLTSTRTEPCYLPRTYLTSGHDSYL